jgi:hypothetical protein
VDEISACRPGNHPEKYIIAGNGHLNKGSQFTEITQFKNTTSLYDRPINTFGGEWVGWVSERR